MVDQLQDDPRELGKRLLAGRRQSQRDTPRQAPGVQFGGNTAAPANSPFGASRALQRTPVRTSFNDLSTRVPFAPGRGPTTELATVQDAQEQFLTRSEAAEANERMQRRQLNKLASSFGYDDPVAYFKDSAENLRSSIRARHPDLTRQRIPASAADVADIGVGRIRNLFGTANFTDEDFADQLKADQLDEVARLLTMQDSAAFDILQRIDLGFRSAAAVATIAASQAPGVAQFLQGASIVTGNQFGLNQQEAQAAVSRFLNGQDSAAVTLERIQDASHLPPFAFGAGELVTGFALPPFAGAGPLRGAEGAVVRVFGRGAGRLNNTVVAPVQYATGRTVGTGLRGVATRAETVSAVDVLKERFPTLAKAAGVNANGPLDNIAFTAPETGSRISDGLQMVQHDISRREKLWTYIRYRGDPQTAEWIIQAKNMVETAKQSALNFMHKAESRASVFGSQANAVANRAFTFADDGTVPALAGIDPTLKQLAPTIQDVAARYPRFAAQLTDEQRTVMEFLRRNSESYVEWITRHGRELPDRVDIIEGGFYLHRGTVDLVEAIPGGAAIRGSIRGIGGKKSFERAASAPSMAEAIATGEVTYPSIGDAMSRFVVDSSASLRDDWLAAYFKNLVDPVTGEKLGRSLADRVDPALRAEVEALRARASNLVRTRTRQDARRASQKQAAKEITELADATQTETMRRSRTLAAKAERETTDAVLSRLEGEIDTLIRQLNRQHRAASRAGNRQAGTQSDLASTIQKLAIERTKLISLRARWDHAKRLANQPQFGESRINSIPGLQDLAFDQVLARSVDNMIAELGPTRLPVPFNVLNDLNSLYRAVRATGDNSYPMIQGLFAGAGDSKAAGQMLRVNALAWADEDVLGKFILDFDNQAKLTGRLSSNEWADALLRISGPDTEFSFGQGLSGKLLDIPGVGPVLKHANRAFGFSGDAHRLALADDMLEHELRSGRSLNQVLRSGDIQRIADVANKTTGFTYDKPFGSMGDLLLFAPRFFTSRIQTLYKAALGFTPGARIDQRFARRSLLRLVTGGMALTEFANYAMGNETDRRPIVNGKWNPNFYRIRFGERDWSVFGTWDSMARLITNSISSTATGDLKEVAGTFRGMAGGSVSLGADFITGKDFTGRDVRESPASVALWLVENMTPFAFQELPQTAGSIATDPAARTPGGAVAASSLMLGEFFGMKSSPISFTDVRDIVSSELYGVPYDKKESGRNVLTNAQRRAVQDDPRLQEFTKQFEDQLGDERQQLNQAFQSYDSSKQQSIARLTKIVNSGAQPNAVREAVSEYKTSLFEAYKTAFSTPDVLAALEKSKDKQSITDLLREQYWFAEAPLDAFGQADFATRDAIRGQVLAEARALGISEADVRKRNPLGIADTRVAREVETYNFILDEGLKDYFAIPRQVIGDNERLRATYAEYTSLAATEQRTYRAYHPELIVPLALIDQRRELKRTTDRLVDAIRIVYYESAAKHPQNVPLFATRGIEGVKEWLDRSIAQRLD